MICSVLSQHIQTSTEYLLRFYQLLRYAQNELPVAYPWSGLSNHHFPDKYAVSPD